MESRFRDILKRVFDLNDADVSRDLSRKEIEKWDSLTHMELVISLEGEFGLRFEVEDIIAMTGIPEIRDILKKKGVDL